MSRRRRRMAVGVVLIGLAVLGGALAQPLKAQLGHFLLSRTFDDRMAAPLAEQADPTAWRPWPGADLAPVGELHFESTGDRRVVVDSASGEALAWGVGHVPGTAGLGEPGLTALAGHRDGRFQLLGNVHEGDRVELTTLDGETITYVVSERVVVDSREAELPVVHSGPDELVLATCWPIDALWSGPERLLVTAHRL